MAKDGRTNLLRVLAGSRWLFQQGARSRGHALQRVWSHGTRGRNRGHKIVVVQTEIEFVGIGCRIGTEIIFQTKVEIVFFDHRIVGGRATDGRENSGRTSGKLADARRRGRDASPEWQALRWDLEELRVSLFAQELGARGAVSPKKLAQRLAALT